MAQDITKLSQRIRQRRFNVYDKTNRIARGAFHAGTSYLITETPVDTGEARSNWLGSVDAPNMIAIPPYVPYPTRFGPGYVPGDDPGGRKSETANANAAISQNDEMGRSFDCRRNEKLISRNNVLYMELLDMGWSQQSQPGWVERVLGRAIIAARKIWEAK